MNNFFFQLLDKIIDTLINDNIINEDTAVIVKLNGLLHTDDRIALQDITRQLNLAEGLESTVSLSFQDSILHLLNKLKATSKEGNFTPTVVFVLNEFHLFCKHKNQILLYNLFDIAQFTKASVCVVGVTYYTDIMDLLEKRVLSRFSHRVIWINCNMTVEERLEIFKTIFTLDHKDLEDVHEM